MTLIYIGCYNGSDLCFTSADLANQPLNSLYESAVHCTLWVNITQLPWQLYTQLIGASPVVHHNI